MQPHKYLLKSLFGKTALAGAVLSGFLLFAGAPSAQANDWDDCNRRAAYTDWRLHESIEHFGYYSPQANHWRHERHEAFERLEHYRHEWRERDWHDRERREHRRDYDGRRYYRDRDGDHRDRDRD